MPLKPSVRSNWPPGGWEWFQPETGWHAPEPFARTFQQQVKAIIEHRKANPRFKMATDPDVVADQLDAYTCARLQNNPKFCEGAPKKAPSLSHLPRLAGVVELVAGADPSVLQDWLGDGKKPVAGEVANRRAAICAKCPENVKKGWREWLTAPVAAGIHLYLEAKHQLQLSTPHDDALGVCRVCRCHLPLKVFTPIEFIKDNTAPEDLQKLDPNCWVRKELSI